MTLPNSVVTGAARFTLGLLNQGGGVGGYRWVFGSAALFFLLGTVAVSRLRTVR